MMYAQGLCRGCADFYKAWAYYYEAAGDYKNADLIFKCGKKEVAQPYDELAIAHQNFLLSVGQQVSYLISLTFSIYCISFIRDLRFLWIRVG